MYLFQNILKFWLDRGVDGFYIRDSGFLFEDFDIRDEVLLSNQSDPVGTTVFMGTFTGCLLDFHLPVLTMTTIYAPFGWLVH